MDRSKLPIGKRPMKGKGHAPPGDFIALGKSKSGSEPDVSRLQSTSVQQKKLLGLGKRDSPTPPIGASLVSKKPKLSSQTFTPLGRQEGRSHSPALLATQYEEYALECEAVDLLENILDAEECGDDERIEGLLCGAVKSLKANRTKPDQILVLTLMSLAKTKSSMFQSEIVCDAFCTLLRKEPMSAYKIKSHPLIPVLCANVLMAAFQDEENWPDSMVKVYVEDCLGDRTWVDRTDCKTFVENIETAFQTKLPTKSLSAADVAQGLDQPKRPSPCVTPDGEEKMSAVSAVNDPMSSEISLEADEPVVFPRYLYQMESMEAYVLNVVQEQLQRRSSLDAGNRNLLKLLTSTSGYGEVRLIAATRLEMWLQNPKLQKTAQDLLAAVCLNCSQHDQYDVEVMSLIIKIRLKTKPLLLHYLSCLRDLIGLHSENVRTLLTHTIYNELSQSRNPNNMSVLAELFKHTPEKSAQILAEIFQDLLSNRDDYLRALMALFREIVRSVRHDINFPAFCLGLMKERQEAKFTEMEFKERFVSSIVSMISLSQLLCITPSVKEASVMMSRGDGKDLAVLGHFRQQLAIIQRDAVCWLHTLVPKLTDVRKIEYTHYLKKVLFLEQGDHYYKVDNWPPETDRNMMLRLCSEVLVLEDTLMRVLVMGMARDLPVNPADSLDLADHLIKRAAALHTHGNEVLVVEKLDMMEAILNLSAYHHPDNIALPKGYTPPELAISNLYWKAWTMLLILSAFNPSTFGFAAWESYPTLKYLMEMAMTNNFYFPPPTVTIDERSIEEIRTKEKQTVELDKQLILEFEGHLASNTITEHNSLLISQLIGMNPTGTARKPPKHIGDMLKHLNSSLKLGQLLCSSRSPDFLLDTIQRQGTSQAMPWLAELVESSDGSLDMFPVQCLCEFLLHDSIEEDTDSERKSDKSRAKQKVKKQQQMLGRLQRLVHDGNSKSRDVVEVLDYFLKRLTSQQASSRIQAFKGLSMVLSKTELSQEPMDVTDVSIIPQHAWLLQQLPSLPLFDEVKDKVCSALRQACQIETSAQAVSAYVLFLAQHTQTLQLHELDHQALDIAQLIVERSTIISHVLPSTSQHSQLQDQVLAAMTNMFYNYIERAKAPQQEAYSWSDTQDQIILQWPSGDSATMHVLVVHAMIILLTFGKPKVDSHFDSLLETWFPASGSPPSAYLVDTSEEALLLPDWLKLRMIRSSVSVLVDSALLDLEPTQLLLFIQSFGIPVQSMSKLLSSLDAATTTDRSSVDESVIDKTFMAQLIRVQWKRGATGGKQFYTVLDDGADCTEEDYDAELTVPKHKKHTPPSDQMPVELPIPRDEHAMRELIARLFGSPDCSREQRQHIYFSLHKAILKDMFLMGLFLDSLNQLLQTAASGSIIHGMEQNLAVSCSLLRTVYTSQGLRATHSQQVAEITRALFSGASQSGLLSVVKQFLQSWRSDGQSVDNIKKFWNSMQHPGAQRLASEDLANLEKFIDKKVRTSLSKNSATELTAKITSYLLNNGSDMPDSTRSLLIDWLELTDSEVIRSCPRLQQQLIFSKQYKEKSGMNRTRCQPYLLSLLTHSTSWDTLNNTLDQLLGEKAQIDMYSPSYVLDFAWACIYIPKIWRGVEIKTARVHTPEDMLALTRHEVTHLLQYIIMEASDKEDTAAAKQSIHQRIELVATCCHDRPELLHTAADFLERSSKSDRPKEELYTCLLLQLYLKEPSVLFWLEQSTIDRLLRCTDTQAHSSCQFDVLSHQLVSALANIEPGRRGEDKLYDTNIACRKVATRHPTLMLRQLSMIGGLLRGRVNYTMTEFQNRNHLALFTHVLGLLELLQPYIFHSEHSSALSDTLQAFFDLVKVHGLQQKELVPLVNKLVLFCSNYMEASPKAASLCLNEHLDLLKHVVEVYPEMPSIRSLLATLCLPTLEDSAESCLVAPRPTSPYSVEQLAPFLKKISKGQKLETVLEVLDDLDKTSRRKTDVLQHFATDLKRLMCDPSTMCRSTTYTLVMRYMRHKPSCAHEFVPAFLQCFDSANEGVVESALRNLPEFTLLCQEKIGEILEKVFLVGMSTKVDTSSYISDTMQLLNLDSLQDWTV